MKMSEWVEMWEAMSNGKSVKVPAQIHIRGQLRRIIEAFGSEREVYEYFKKVMESEPAEIVEGE